jgi:hypothetical protein
MMNEREVMFFDQTYRKTEVTLSITNLKTHRTTTVTLPNVTDAS